MGVAEKHHTDRLRPPIRLRTRLIGPTVLSLIVIGFFWKLALSDEFLWMDSPDPANQVLPWLQFQAGELRAGRFPLWDPYQWAGQPLLAQMQPGTANPLNWILFLVPLRHGWLRFSALNWYFVGIHLVAAWMAYWLCRDRGLGTRASIFGGLAFSLSGWTGTTSWPQMLSGAVWAPAVFLFIFRAVEGNRPLASALLSGFFLGLSWLSGHHQAPVFLTLGAMALWLHALFLRRTNAGRALICVAIFLVSTGLTSGLQTLPAAEYGRLAVRWTGAPQPTAWADRIPYSVHQNLSLSPVAGLAVVTPMFDQNVNPIAGVTILSLAVLGVVGCWRELWVRMIVLVSALALVVAMGTYSPLHGVLYVLVPLVEKARSPFVSIFIFNFGLSVLAGCGISSLMESREWRPARVAGLALIAVSTAAGAGALVISGAGKVQAAQNMAVTALAALGTGSLLLADFRGMLSSGALFSGLVIASLTELTVGGLIAGLPSRYLPIREFSLDRLAGLSETVGFLRTEPRPFRVGLDNRDVPFNFGDWHGIETTGGYLASLTANVSEVGTHSEIWQRLLGARYYLAKAPLRENQKVLFQDPGGFKLYENPGAFPRAWVIHELAEFNSRGEISDFISNNPDKLRLMAPTTLRGVSLQSCAGAEEVRVLENRPGRTVLEADLACRGLVVVSEVYYPGWQAVVDTGRTPIHEVYGCLRGVVVERGRHRIEFSYRPGSVYAGAAMTVAGSLAALLAALTGFRRSRSAILASA